MCTADVRGPTPVEALRFTCEKIRKDLKFLHRASANLTFDVGCMLGERLAKAMVVTAPPG